MESLPPEIWTLIAGYNKCSMSIYIINGNFSRNSMIIARSIEEAYNKFMDNFKTQLGEIYKVDKTDKRYTINYITHVNMHSCVVIEHEINIDDSIGIRLLRGGDISFF